IQSILPGFSAKLNWTSDEASYSQDTSGMTSFLMTFEVDEKPRTLMTDSLVIKNFLHKTVVVYIFFGHAHENEPTLNLSNGIALVVNDQHYKDTMNTKEFFICYCVYISILHGCIMIITIQFHRISIPQPKHIPPPCKLSPPETISFSMSVSQHLFCKEVQSVLFSDSTCQ
uniref:Uncharacterized protein n=1 Tax=Sus scrofa TaxID=9823 RepID=A0A8D1WIU0_PIG